MSGRKHDWMDVVLWSAFGVVVIIGAVMVSALGYSLATGKIYSDGGICEFRIWGNCSSVRQ